MKKWFVTMFLALGLSIPAYSEQVKTPEMSGSDPRIEYAGVSTYRITSTQSTNATWVSSSPVIVYGVSASSIAATSYLSLYSTNSVLLVGASPVKNQFNDNNQPDEDVTTTNEYKWVEPVKFTSGLVVKASAAVDPAGACEWVVYYRVAN